MKLEEALGGCTTGLLRRIAVGLGIAPQPDTLRSELVGGILHRLMEPGFVDGCAAALPPEEVALLQAVRSWGWTARAFIVDRRFGPGALPRTAGGLERSGLALSLLHRGILFRGFATVGTSHGEVYFVPEELQPPLTARLPALAPPDLPDPRSEAVPDAGEEIDVVYDLFCLLSFLQRHPRRAAGGTLARADLDRLEREARLRPAGDSPSDWERRWPFLLHLCLSQGWAIRQGTLLKLGRQTSDLLSGPNPQLRSRLLEAYLKDRGWSDLAAAGRVRQLLGGRRIDEPAGRCLLLHQLERWRGAEWIDPELFVRAIHSTDPDLLREDYSSPAWAVVEAATGAELYGPLSWDVVEGEWLRQLLGGPLRWLGVVQWGTVQGKPAAFRVPPSHPPGEPEDLGSTHQEAPRLLPTRDGMELLLPEGVDLGLLLQMEPYLELRRRDGMGSYRLTHASALEGVEGGGSWDELRGLLLRLASEPPPAQLLDRLAEWEAASKGFVLEAGLLLTAATEGDADLLSGSPELARCLEARLGPRSFRVARERMWELVELLRRAGRRPRVDVGARTLLGRSAAREADLLRECLFALLLARELSPGTGSRETAEALRRLRAALGPEEVAEASRRARLAARVAPPRPPTPD